MAALSAGDSRFFHFSRGDVYSVLVKLTAFFLAGANFVLPSFSEGDDTCLNLSASYSTGANFFLPFRSSEDGG